MTGSVLNYILILTIINLSCHRFPSLLLRMLIRIAKSSQLVYVHFIIFGNALTGYPLLEALSLSQKFKISLRTPQKTHCVFIVRTNAVNEHYRCLFVVSCEIHEYCLLFGKTAKIFTVKVDYPYSNHYAMKSSLCLNSYNSQRLVLRLIASWDWGFEYRQGSCECCLLSGRGLCYGPITRQQESCRVCMSLRVNKCDIKLYIYSE